MGNIVLVAREVGASAFAAAISFFAVLGVGAGDVGAQSGESGISAIWANEGGDKVLREERRASGGATIVPSAGVTNSVWDGKSIRLFGAKNEIVNFVLVLESCNGASGVSVAFDRLDGEGGASITTRAARGGDVFDYRGRNIELFLVHYLPIKGVSMLSYELYDERWLPSKMQRPFQVVPYGSGSGRTVVDRANEGWAKRPGADKNFPEIAVPIEARSTFDVMANSSQSLWSDIYIPKSTQAGVYKGIVRVTEQGQGETQIPIELIVRDFTLPDRPSSIAAVAVGVSDISERFLGKENRFVGFGDNRYPRLLPILERYWQMLHRHRIVPILDESSGVAPPRPPGVARLNGSMYSAAKRYEGPGQNTGDSIYFIGPYGGWSWADKGQGVFNAMSDAWMTWFAANTPTTQKVLYLIDEPNFGDATQAVKINGWLDKLAANPGPGRQLPTLVTSGLRAMRERIPRVNFDFDWYSVADTQPYQKLVDEHLAASPENRIWQYNGKRPASGSFATEDDGVSPRMMPWAAYKKGIGGWFYWSTSYYLDYQSGAGPTDLWRQAKTFGPKPKFDPVRGETSSTYSNGDGVLQYPGLDMLFMDTPAPNLEGPIASLRLKLWRRGLQDIDYVTLAAARDPKATKAIVDQMVPKVLWEVGVFTSRDPSFQHAPPGQGVGWSINPDDWEAARKRLADIIEGKSAGKP